MLFRRFAVNKDIIKVNDNKFSRKRFKNMIHKMHKCTGSIRESKWHDHPFIKAISSFESYLPFIIISHANLMTSATKIRLEKIVAP
jgi:hypothetical protein